MADAEVDPLPIPPAAQEQGGVEVLRALIVKGKLEVALRRAFEDPDVWGLLITDVARHAARIFATETELSEDQALAKIRAMFEAELDSPTDPGSTSAVS
ncbi:MAG: DUF5076 domain-containing protein [Pseudolabrys sp.]